MGNAQRTDFLTCVLEIQARSWLYFTPQSFSARDKIVLEGEKILERLQSLLTSLAFVPASKTYKPPAVLATKVLCDSDWHIEWSILNRLVDELEQCSPSQEELGRAKPHLEQCVKRIKRGIDRHR